MKHAVEYFDHHLPSAAETRGPTDFVSAVHARDGGVLLCCIPTAQTVSSFPAMKVLGDTPTQFKQETALVTLMALAEARLGTLTFGYNQVEFLVVGIYAFRIRSR